MPGCLGGRRHVQSTTLLPHWPPHPWRKLGIWFTRGKPPVPNFPRRPCPRGGGGGEAERSSPGAHFTGGSVRFGYLDSCCDCDLITVPQG